MNRSWRSNRSKVHGNGSNSQNPEDNTPRPRKHSCFPKESDDPKYVITVPVNLTNTTKATSPVICVPVTNNATGQYAPLTTGQYAPLTTGQYASSPTGQYAPLTTGGSQCVPLTQGQAATQRSSFELSGNRIFMTNKSCHVSPDHEDFTQKTSSFKVKPDKDQYHNLLLEQYGFEPSAKEQIAGFKKIMHDMCPRVDNSSQYVDPEPGTLLLSSSPWYYVENPEEIDELLKKEKKSQYTSKDIRISENPQVKVVAEKYTRYKKNNVELRKLEERIVCVEYDVFQRGEAGASKKNPVQTMRAYFSIKTSCSKCQGGSKLLNEVPSKLKERLNIKEEDVKNFNEREIEVIDNKISENKPYLDDLARILKKKQVLNMKKEKTTLDLVSLYDMAMREAPPLDDDFSQTNLLSKAALQEVKHLILEKCESTAHGICRRIVKNTDQVVKEVNPHSDSVFYALLRGI